MTGKLTKRLNPICTRRLDSLTTMGMGVAHDFNNLLAAILGNSVVVSRTIPEDFVAAESVHQIESCALRGIEMTGRILAFTGQAPFTARKVNLSKMILGMNDQLHEFSNGKITVKLKLKDNMPDIMGDVAQIRQLVMDLAANSSETLIERTGTIKIETGTMNCDEEYLHAVSLGKDLPRGRYAYVQVSDDGKGIPTRIQKRIFEPFFSTKLRGQGLGLCVVIGVLRAHNGAIEVWTRVHKGSRFKAIFPLSPGK